MTLLKVLGFPDLQIFLEIFCTNLLSPVWSRHVGVNPPSLIFSLFLQPL